MNTYVNYMIEANLGLLLFIAAYIVFLGRETDFKLKRYYLLTGLVCSIVFPLLHLTTRTEIIPSISSVITTMWLPELQINGDGTAQDITTNSPTINYWSYVLVFYCAGSMFFIFSLIYQLIAIVRLKKRPAYKKQSLFIVESNEDKPTFSFFNFIFIGQANLLTQQEKQQIIEHERIHAEQQHSLDLMILHVITIFFWFNPILKFYKKTFIHLHEFEADARAVKNLDVNDYCKLLARVALLAVDVEIVNYFSNSLTVKRIEMMRKIKTKIRTWKLGAIALVVPLTFFILACQEQLANEVTEITKSSTMAIDIPDEVQLKYDELQKAHPDKQFIVMETDQKLEPKISKMKSKMESIDPKQIASINVITPTAKNSEPVRTFVIVEYNEQTEMIQQNSKDVNDVYTVVEESAQPKGGMTAFYDYVMKNLLYPKEARMKGIQGKVFIEFVVNENGTLSDFRIMKGVDKMIDDEALRVIQESDNWIPGMNKGVAVKQKMVMPISFSLNNMSLQEVKKPEGALEEVVVVGH